MPARTKTIRRECAHAKREEQTHNEQTQRAKPERAKPEREDESVQQNLVRQTFSPIVTTPSSVADIVGFSIRLARDNVRFLVKILFWPSLIELVGKVISLIGINAIMTAGQGNMFVVAGVVMTITVGGTVGLGAEFFLSLRQLALVRMFMGYEDNFEDAYKFIWKKKFQLLFAIAATNALFIVSLLTWSVEVGVSVALMTNKALALLAFVGACWGLILLMFSMLWSVLPVVLIAPALAVETRPFSQMLSKTVKLGFGNAIRATYFLLLLGLVLFFLSSVLNIPPTVFSMIELGTNYLGGHPAAKAPNLFGQIFASVWRSAANMVMSPMAFFASALFYIDLRMRADGLDITRRLELLSKKSGNL